MPNQASPHFIFLSPIWHWKAKCFMVGITADRIRFWHGLGNNSTWGSFNANSVATVFAANDLQAIGIFKRFSEAGIRIPQDVSLLGYSGMEEGELLSSPLTSVAHPLMELGRRACERIINLIEEKGEEPKFEELPDKLVVRKSCGPPPAGG